MANTGTVAASPAYVATCQTTKYMPTHQGLNRAGTKQTNPLKKLVYRFISKLIKFASLRLKCFWALRRPQRDPHLNFKPLKEAFSCVAESYKAFDETCFSNLQPMWCRRHSGKRAGLVPEQPGFESHLSLEKKIDRNANAVKHCSLKHSLFKDSNP